MRKFHKHVILYVIGLATWFASDLLHAKESDDLAFAPIYLGGSLSQPHPTSFSEQDYQSGSISSVIHYRFFMHDQWVVGLSGGFKTLKKLDDTEISFFSVSQDSARLFRVYHPTWIGIGFKSMMLVGVERVAIPFARNPDEPQQVGVGASLSVLHLATKSTLIHAEVTRWRGTANNRLHMIEFSLGASLGLGYP